ncbi:DUF7221 family queuine tRNA-ribosyltransferase-like protein [Sorangium sp. So ce388]|uniref:deazapurine DNA modification protein DpdA family protein n=1 Tax=Sorangium sp. So ce388 TaxID=3133309 RepID=UPI003F5BEE9C
MSQLGLELGSAEQPAGRSRRRAASLVQPRRPQPDQLRCSFEPPGQRIGDLVRFYLGTHHPSWLASAGVPLFVSRRSLAGRKSFPRAIAPWSEDSSGFSEAQLYGHWTITAKEYANEVRRHRDEIGMLDWAAPQDWMCEPIVRSGGRSGREVFVGTKLSVLEHQRRTVDNLVELRGIAPDVHWMPVIQGWTPGEYLDCVELYARAKIDLTQEPIVGVGTVCRRQNTITATLIMSELASLGLRLHGFGYKIEGLQAAARHLASADSLAWSENGKYRLIPGHDKPGPGRRTGHKNCANCLEFAMDWRNDLLERRAA